VPDADAVTDPLPADDEDVVSALERLVRLREGGSITEAEFQSAKSRLLR
jgi:hypothetical protein